MANSWPRTRSSTSARRTRRPTRASCFACMAWRRTDVRALAARGNHYKRGVPQAPVVVRSHARRRHIVTAAASAGASSPATATRPSTRRFIAPTASVLIAGDMLLPKISTNVAVWPSDPDGDPLGRFLHFARRVRVAAAAHAGAAVARLAVSRHRDARRAAARASRRAPRASSTTRSPPRPAPVSAARDAADAVPPRARLAAALFRHGRSHRAPQPPVAARPRRAASRRRRHAVASHCLDSTLRGEKHDVHTRHRKLKTTLDPVALARIARRRRREEREGHRRVRVAQASAGAAALRRAGPRQGVHGARGADARQSGAPGRVADEPVVGLHEPVAGLDAAHDGRPVGARRRAGARATSASSTRTGTSTSCSTTSSRATSSPRAGCTTRSRASTASTSTRRRKSTSSRASTSTRSRRPISR